MSGPDTEPTYVLEGREALTPVFEALNQYQATTHFNGQSTVVLDGERATGESYTIAHHLFTADGERKIMIASLRYLDTFVKTGNAWLFAEQCRGVKGQAAWSRKIPLAAWRRGERRDLW
jgi:hypothetical protein